jgi:8-oxo-dGTP pyrophosphatase MutT (NUDIX family)
LPSERSCGAVVFTRDGELKYLLLHYEAGHWDFVKGHIEGSESELQTLRREIQEETGLNDVKLIEGFRERISYFYQRKGRTVFKEVIFYLVESPTETVKISSEHVGYDWLSYEDAQRRLTYHNAKDILKKANSFLMGVQFGLKQPQISSSQQSSKASIPRAP